MSGSNARGFVKSAYLKARKVLLTAGGRIPRLGSAMAAAAPVEPRNILFIRVDRIGDMVLSIPAFRELKRTFPASRLTVLASRSNASLLRHDPYVDHVIVWNGHRSGFGSSGFLRRAARLARNGYDVAIDPMTGHDLHTALIAFLSRAPIRIGFSGYGREVFFNRLCRMEEGWHIAELMLETTRQLQAAPAGCSPGICLIDQERDEAKRWLANRRLGGRPLVGFHLGAHYPSQRWPVEYFAELARGLHGHDCDVLVVGGPGEQDLVRFFKTSVGERVIVCESFSLRQMAAVVAETTALVCNNSGPLHIAAALGVPTLSFMGPTEKDRWMPIGQHHIVMRQDRLECIGCNRGICEREDHACMRMINPKAALSALLPMVRDRPAPTVIRSAAKTSRTAEPQPTHGRGCGSFESPSYALL
jgi:lipopolysaccharide heptosyltransferase II